MRPLFKFQQAVIYDGDGLTIPLPFDRKDQEASLIIPKDTLGWVNDVKEPFVGYYLVDFRLGNFVLRVQIFEDDLSEAKDSDRIEYPLPESDDGRRHC